MARSCAKCGKSSMGGFNPQSSGMNRVRAKRPLMGAACSAADVLFVTSDNPRTEDPQAIIREVLDEARVLNILRQMGADIEVKVGPVDFGCPATGRDGALAVAHIELRHDLEAEVLGRSERQGNAAVDEDDRRFRSIHRGLRSASPRLHPQPRRTTLIP